MFSGVYVAEGVDGVGDEVSGDTTTFDIQTLFEAFSRHVPETCLLC